MSLSRENIQVIKEVEFEQLAVLLALPLESDEIDDAAILVKNRAIDVAKIAAEAKRQRLEEAEFAKKQAGFLKSHQH